MVKPLGTCPAQHPEPGGGAAGAGVGFSLEFHSRGSSQGRPARGVRKEGARAASLPRAPAGPAALGRGIPRSPLGGGDVCGEWTLGVLGARGSEQVSPLGGAPGLVQRMRLRPA